VTSAAAPAVRPQRTAAPARPLTVPGRPRRVSGPARRGVDDQPARRRSEDHRGVALGLIAAVERLTRHRWLGGRTWIAVIAFALIGIVTMQLGLLKLNAGIGRALEHEALLQRENAALSIEDSELAASGRVTSLAVRLGMEPVPAGALKFLEVRPGIDARLGAAALSAPAHLTGPGESAANGSSGASSSSGSGEQSGTESAARSASTESSSQSSATTLAPAEPSTSESPATSSAAQPPPASREPARTSGESTGTTATAPAEATPGTGSAEGTPAGGTQAGSSG
jgi:hypothetical protein